MVQLKLVVTKSIAALVALQLILAPAAAIGQQGQSPFPERPTGMVTDAAGVIPDEVEATITARLSRLRDSTGGEVAVVTLPSIGDRTAADVALDIGRSWGVGGDFPVGDPRRNAGVVLLVVPRSDDRSGAVYLASGQGTEGFLTDAMAGRIVDAMLPRLRDGDYGEAIDVGTTLVTDLVARELGATDPVLLVEHRPLMTPGRMILLAFLVVVIFLAIAFAVGSSGGGGAGGIPSGRQRSRGGWGSPMIGGGGLGGGFGGGFGGGMGGGGFGGFGGGGGFSGGGAGRSF